MKNIFTRILALLFAVMMLVSVVACTKDPDQPKDSETPATTDPITPDDSGTVGETDPADVDWQTKNFYNGETLTVLAYDTVGANKWSNIPEDVFLEENDGEILSSAVYQRAIVLKDKLGIQLAMVRWGSGFSKELLRDVNDGEYQYQLLIQQTNAINLLVNNRTIQNISGSGLDVSYPWFDTDAASMFTVKGTTLAVTSDMTFQDKICSVAVFYNKQMASDNNLGNLYELVNEKKWNFDTMLSMAETVVPTIDADGQYTVDDTYGISCQNDGAYYFYNAAGLTSLKGTSNGGLELALNSEDSVDVLEKILKLTKNNRVYLNRQSKDTKLGTTTEIVEHFASNKALFLVRPLQTLFELTQATDNYGIIPVPMFSETQEEYYTPVNTYASTHMCLPPKLTNADMTIDAVQWLSDYSQENIVPLLYEVVLGSRLTQDKDSPKMLDIIFGNRLYDIGIIWNITNVRDIIISKIGAGGMVEGSVKTSIDKYVVPINLSIDKLITDIESFDAE